MPILSTLRARLTIVSVTITVASLLVLATGTFWTARNSNLATIDANIGQPTRII